MSRPLFDPAYWDARTASALARGRVHLSIYEGPEADVAAVGATQTASLLPRLVSLGVGGGGPASLLDLGCGYGRLIDLLRDAGRPVDPRLYLGLDLSPAMVEQARLYHPGYTFEAADLRTVITRDRYDVGVCLWVKSPVVANLGEDAWADVETHCRTLCNTLLVVD